MASEVIELFVLSLECGLLRFIKKLFSKEGIGFLLDVNRKQYRIRSSDEARIRISKTPDWLIASTISEHGRSFLLLA